MIFNNERYETVAFWDKYKHVLNVYITAGKKDFTLPTENKEAGRSAPCVGPAGSSGAAGVLGLLVWLHRLSERKVDEGSDSSVRQDSGTNKRMWRRKRKT